MIEVGVWTLRTSYLQTRASHATIKRRIGNQTWALCATIEASALTEDGGARITGAHCSM